jgi:hypothetical protein
MEKVRQARACVSWLAETSGPIVVGADANTPEFDMPDFEQTRTHWHTGMKKLAGCRGDDILFGPDRGHDLTDAFRSWLAQNPEKLERLRADFPQGPLAISHRTGRRKDSPGIARRFDAVWLSADFAVHSVTYPYDQSIDAGSDHSAVVTDISLRDL